MLRSFSFHWFCCFHVVMGEVDICYTVYFVGQYIFFDFCVIDLGIFLDSVSRYQNLPFEIYHRVLVGLINYSVGYCFKFSLRFQIIVWPSIINYFSDLANKSHLCFWNWCVRALKLAVFRCCISSCCLHSAIACLYVTICFFWLSNAGLHLRN